MSESEHQVNKAHNRKKDKFKKKSFKKNKFNAENIDYPDEDNQADNRNDKDADGANKDEYSKDKLKNPRAFAINSFVAAERQFRRSEFSHYCYNFSFFKAFLFRTQDIKEKRSKVPEVDRTALEPPPIVVAIVGPPSVGKSTLMQNLIKNYTRQKLSNLKGPVTVVTNKNRRLTIIECNNDLNSMIDIAKIADLILLMIDASFGFEMETFEFLNICQVHGFPRIMGVLTHMDLLTNTKQLKKTKKRLKHRFWTEIYQVLFF
jgi:ribosome biogenesis protein BMS1